MFSDIAKISTKYSKTTYTAMVKKKLKNLRGYLSLMVQCTLNMSLNF